jgi:ABC-2 type transport system permease protein
MTVTAISDMPQSDRLARTSGFGLSAISAMFGLTIRQHLNGKRWMVLAGLFLLPVGLAILIRAVSPDVPHRLLEFLLAFMFIPQALLPLVALVYASGIIQDEQEDQTLTYLLVRPLPKWSIYVVKLLGTLTTAVLLTSMFTILTYIAVYIGSPEGAGSVVTRCLKAVGIHSLAVISYSCLFGLLSLFTRYTLIIGILYTALVEGLLANLPFGIRLATVIYYTRLIAYRSLDFIVNVHGHTTNASANAWQLDVRNDPNLLEHPSLRSCLMILAGASILLTFVGAAMCSRCEFRVKTPGGN